jgi:hypothetical protein
MSSSYRGYFGNSLADSPFSTPLVNLTRTIDKPGDLWCIGNPAQKRQSVGPSYLITSLLHSNYTPGKSLQTLPLTHFDTSTGILSNSARIAETVRRVSPETLVVVDAVCSVASE